MSHHQLAVSRWASLFISIVTLCGFMTAAMPVVNAATPGTDLKPCVHKTSKKPPTKITKTESVNFSTTDQDDSSLPQGQTKITQAGHKGTKTRTYKATYNKKHKLTGCKLTASKLTTAPVNQMIAVGTYVAPAPAPTPPAPSTNDSTYTNVDGNQVQSPSSNPTGATAQCADGSYSYSQHRSGTCSHHGGVASWL